MSWPNGMDTSLGARSEEGSGAGPPVLESSSQLLLSVRPRASYLTSPDPHFLTEHGHNTLYSLYTFSPCGL